MIDQNETNTVPEIFGQDFFSIRISLIYYELLIHQRWCSMSCIHDTWVQSVINKRVRCTYNILYDITFVPRRLAIIIICMACHRRVFGKVIKRVLLYYYMIINTTIIRLPKFNDQRSKNNYYLSIKFFEIVTNFVWQLVSSIFFFKWN